MPRIVSLAVLLVLIVAFGMTFYRVVAPFFLPLFLAAMTAVVCKPVYHYFLKRTKNHIPLAAGMTTAAILATGLIPIVTGTLIASLQFYTFASEINSESVRPVIDRVVNTVVEKVNNYRPEENQLVAREVTRDVMIWLHHSLTDIGDRSLGKAAGTTYGVLKGVAGMAIKVTIGLMIYAIALYYFFADGTKLLQAGESMIPVHIEYQRQLMAEFSKVVRSVVMATFLAALAQGLATTLAVGVLGFDHLMALFALASFAALIPLAGTWLVWLPCALWLFTFGHPIQGTLLTLYCVVFVGFLDNVVRTYVLNTSTRLHPLLAFVSVLGGIEVMGLWGVFIGPIVACFLHALVKVFNIELQQLSRDRGQNGESDPEGRAEKSRDSEEVPVASISEDPIKTSRGTPAATSAPGGSTDSDTDDAS